MINYTAPLLSDLKQSLADRKTNGVLPTDSATLSLWIRTFNRAVKYCIEKLRMQKESAVATTSGVGALPVDFAIALKVVNSAGSELSQISPQDSDLAEGLYYWITGDMINGFSLNVPSDDTFTVHHTYRPSKMAVDADVCPFPDEEAIVAYAYGMLRKAESDPFEDADRALAECDNRHRETESQFALNDQGNQFKLMQNS